MPVIFETKKHKTSYVTISRDEYESMRSTIEILEDKEVMKMIKESRTAVEKGKIKSLEDFANERMLV